MRRRRMTIAAISTAPGEGGIAIVRASGKLSERILRDLFRPGKPRQQYASHRLYYGHAVDAKGEVIDEVMAVIMRAPSSYTCEDVLEIHCHGGAACAKAILAQMLYLGAEIAEPGEFTRRAFMNGRLDLSRAEAVMQLVGARGEAARKASMRQLSGGVSGFVHEIEEALTDLLSMIEAAVDFPDEIDEEMIAGGVSEMAAILAERIEERLSPKGARLLREGASVVLCGRPNVGKSSLLNAIVRQDRAIVTDIPGTTRDVLTERVELGGLVVEISDTAGIRETGDKIERIGVLRARNAVREADVALLVLDGGEALTDADRALLDAADARTILCINKSDLPQAIDPRALPGLETLRLSARGGEGVKALIAAILKRLLATAAGPDIFTVQRHMDLAATAAKHLRDCERAILDGVAVDVASDDLWHARRAIAEISGENAGDAVVDAIFRNFCVGK